MRYTILPALRRGDASQSRGVKAGGCAWPARPRFTWRARPDIAGSMKVSWALSWAFASVVIAVACSSEDTPLRSLDEGCLINSDCSAPLVCAFRRCHVQCKTSFDCDPGQRCVTSERPDHVCQAGSERHCSYNSDCPVGQVCGIDQECRDQCAGNSDCVPGQLCVASTCVSPAGSPRCMLVARAEAEVTNRAQPCQYSSQCPEPLISAQQHLRPRMSHRSRLQVGIHVRQQSLFQRRGGRRSEKWRT